MVMSGVASASTSFFSSWPPGLAIQSARSRTNVVRLVTDHESDVALSLKSFSSPLAGSAENVAAPRVNVICFPSGDQAETTLLRRFGLSDGGCRWRCSAAKDRPIRSRRTEHHRARQRLPFDALDIG